MGTQIRRAAVVWASAGTLLLAWSGVAAGMNAGSDAEYDDKVADARKQQNFWRIVASQGEGPPGVLNKLATDLRDLPAEDLPKFQGDSNRYGGITAELGFDPFNGVNCSECGPLDEQVIEDVVAARSGQLQTVLDRLEPEEPDKTSGAPWLLWLAWFASYPSYAAVSFVRRKRTEERKYSEYGPEMELVRSLDETRGGLNNRGRRYLELTTLRDDLMDSINMRIKYGEEEARELKLEALKQEAQETLEAIKEGNRALNR